MAKTIDGVIKHMIQQNNYGMKIAFPAVVVNADNLKDGLIDVQPIVNYLHPLTSETMQYPTLFNIPVIFPSTKNSTICFPIEQGDFVEIFIQSVDIQKFKNGLTETHDPATLNYNNLANAVAIVGFNPYQNSCFNPSNYIEDFDNKNLNIVHNKNTENESSITIDTEGVITLKAPTRVVVESKEVQVLADKIDAGKAVISTLGDVNIKGASVERFMKLHTHLDSTGSTTTPPQPIPL